MFITVSGWSSAREGTSKKKMWKILNIIEFMTKIIDISNIFVFFLKGAYPTLLYRIMRMKTVRSFIIFPVLYST